MSRAAIVYFTDKGAQLGKMLAEKLDCTAQKPPRSGLAALVGKLFHEADALIFIGACGIAPAVSINGQVYPKVAVSAVPGIIQELREREDN